MKIRGYVRCPSVFATHGVHSLPIKRQMNAEHFPQPLYVEKGEAPSTSLLSPRMISVSASLRHSFPLLTCAVWHILAEDHWRKSLFCCGCPVASTKQFVRDDVRLQSFTSNKLKRKICWWQESLFCKHEFTKNKQFSKQRAEEDFSD